MPKTLSSAKLKRRLDKVFSLWVRLSARRPGLQSVWCYTCGKAVHWKLAHAGHYIPRHHLATRWDERNVKPQCAGCNLWGNGRPDIFAVNLERDYGPGILQKLERAKREVRKFGRPEIQMMVDYYENKLKNLNATMV